MSLFKELKGWLKGYRKVVILGIGNPLRGDDAIGLIVAKHLKGKVPSTVNVLLCETVPESFSGEITRHKPSHVLMIDSAMLNEKPGFSRLIPPEKIVGTAISTHAMPLSVLADYLKKTADAKVVLLGIQPKNVDFSEGLTPELQQAAEQIAKTIEKALVCGNN